MFDYMEEALPGFIQKASEYLSEAEKEYEQKRGPKRYRALRSHSMRAAALARRLAEGEGIDPLAPALGAMLHDAGKFTGGAYHRDGRPEEMASARVAGELLGEAGAPPEIAAEVEKAIADTASDDCGANIVAEIVHDADHLDKLGRQGVAAFFTKNAMRGDGLDEDFLIRISVELTYAHHAPRCMRTAAGSELAARRSKDTVAFYRRLLDELREDGFADCDIVEREWDGLAVLLVAPRCGPCGSLTPDISLEYKKEPITDRLHVTYECPGCGKKNRIAFCLPKPVE